MTEVSPLISPGRLRGSPGARTAVRPVAITAALAAAVQANYTYTNLYPKKLALLLALMKKKTRLLSREHRGRR